MASEGIFHTHTQYNIGWILLLNTIDVKIYTIHYLSEYMLHVFLLVMEVIFRSGTQKQVIDWLLARW